MKGKKEGVQIPVHNARNKTSQLDVKDDDITATFDAQDDEDVVF